MPRYSPGMDASIEDLEARMSDLNGGCAKPCAPATRQAPTSCATPCVRRTPPGTPRSRPKPSAWDPPHLRHRPRSPPPRHTRDHPSASPCANRFTQALTILGAPASPKLISATYQAFFEGQLATTKLASLRRDEERSFTSQKHARPYYICAALNHDRLNPARGLLAVSTWPLERRVIAPLSPRADFLAHAIGTGEQIRRLALTGRQPSDDALRLLRRFAFNIPGAYDGGEPDPARVITSARAEAAVHRTADDAERRSGAERARDQLSDAQQLFGAAPLRDVLGDTSDGTS